MSSLLSSSPSLLSFSLLFSEEEESPEEGEDEVEGEQSGSEITTPSHDDDL
jgi:hypothetical protein